MIAVKVGGSLYDHPGLGAGLDAYLTPLLSREPVWLVPGGGPFVDVIRHLEPIHSFDDESSHWLAVRCLSAAALFLGSFLPGATITDEHTGFFGEGLSILDPYEFLLSDLGQSKPLPTSWNVTSDSIAAWAAAAGNASRLILLKSTDVPLGTPWQEAAAQGWVDAHFPRVVAAHGLDVEVVNFRRWLDENGY